MNIEVGMYVRTEKGIISKIIGIYPDDFQMENRFFVKYDGGFRENYKSSFNIIDLIEEGDYVNGERVWVKESYRGDSYKIKTDVIDSEEECHEFYNEDIKSIVTKEQFASMEYKVGE